MSANTNVNKQEMSMYKNNRLAIMLASAAIFISLFLVALDRLFLPGRFSINEVVISGNAPDVDPAEILAAVKELGTVYGFLLTCRMWNEQLKKCHGYTKLMSAANGRVSWLSIYLNPNRWHYGTELLG